LADNDEDVARAGPEPPESDSYVGRVDDLEAEAQALHRETGRLLVQRRKIQARIKSLFKAILLQEPGLAERHAEVIEHELSAVDENALHFEVWFPEFKQITEVLVEESRDALRRLAEASSQAAEAAAERDRARALIETLETGRILMNGRLDAQAEELDALRNARPEIEARAAQLEAELAEARARMTNAPAERQDMALAEVEARLAETEARYQELGRIYEKDRIENAREIASLTKQLTRVREKYESQLAQLATQNERLAEALADKERAAQTGGMPTASPASSAVAPVQGEAPSGDVTERRRVEAMLEFDGSASGSHQSGGNEARERREVATPQRPPDQVVILDDDGVGQNAASELAEKGYPVTAFSPHPDLVSELSVESIACAVVNLAVPHAWTTVRAIAAMREAPPAWIAYAAARPTAPAYWFGEVSFLVMPVEPQILTRALRRLASRLKQGIVISPDEQMATEISLQLSRARVTGAVARDRAQALEVIKAIYPHVALAHLASSPVDVFRAVAALRGVSLFSRIPVVFMLDGTPHPHEPSLYGAAARTILRLGKLDPRNMATTLAHILGEHLQVPRRAAAAR